MEFKKYSTELFEVVKSVSSEEIENVINILLDTYHNGTTVFLIGNGGSAANSTHFAQDLAMWTKSLENIKRIRALSLTDNFAFASALSNDFGFEYIFEEQLRTFAKPGDTLIAISGSGNSPNIIKAVEWANENSVATIGVTGFDGGKLKRMCMHSLHVQLPDMCSVESVHSVLFHYITLELKGRILESNGKQRIF